MKRDEFLHFVLIPVILGIIGGFSAILFRKLIAIFQHVASFFNFFHSNFFYVIALPLLFLFSHYIIHRLLINPSNITLDNIAKKISLNSGNFSILKGLVVLFLTSLNIGFGLPVGRESPIAKLGGLLGEIFIKTIEVAKVNVPIYLAAAVSSAIAATFNAPLAGIILAIEIIVGRINTYIIIPLIVSTASATLISREFLGDYAAFFVPKLEYGDEYFLLVPLIAVLFAFLALAMVHFFGFFRKVRVALKKNWIKVVFVNGLIVGVLVAYVPQIRGVGYEFISELFKHGYGFKETLVIAFAKFAAVVLTFSSGIFGGLMSPSIFIGSFGGYALGELFASYGVDSRVVALVGSVAMLSGVSKAPLRSTIIIIELTHSYQLLLPSLIASSITSFIVSKFDPGGYLKRSLIQKGIDIENPNVVRFLDNMTASRYLKYIKPLREEMKLKEAFLKFKQLHLKAMPVVDENGRFKGIVSFKDLKLNLKKAKTLKEVTNSKAIVWRDNYTSEEIIKILGIINSKFVPFVDSQGHYVGMVDLEKLIRDLSMVDRYKII